MRLVVRETAVAILLGNGIMSQTRGQCGFIYLAMLVAISLLGVGLLAASEVWTAAAHRQKMAQLQWVGEQYLQAIGSYYQATPGFTKAYPPSLQELLQDSRYLTVRRHLRTIYANPFTGHADWELVMTSDGKIRGVRAIGVSESGENALEFVYPQMKKKAAW